MKICKAQARKEINGETRILDGFLDNETNKFYGFFDSRDPHDAGFTREYIDTYLDALVADLNEAGDTGNWFVAEPDPGIVAVM